MKGSHILAVSAAFSMIFAAATTRLVASAPGHYPGLVGSDPGSARPTATVEGQVVCLDRELRRSEDPDLCNRPDGGAQFALLSVDGALVSLVEGDPQAEMMIDPRVRSLTLQLTGWPNAQGALELLHVHEVRRRAGEPDQLFDLDYRCDLCNITATAPGPCWCCQEPFELRQTPIDPRRPSDPP